MGTIDECAKLERAGGDAAKSLCYWGSVGSRDPRGVSSPPLHGHKQLLDVWGFQGLWETPLPKCDADVD